MDQFIKILAIMTWPIVVLTGMFLFKRDLRSILKRITSVETSTAKMMFNQEMEDVESNLTESSIKPSVESRSWLNEMSIIAKLNPRAAITESWTSIEIACIELGMVQGTSMKRFSPSTLESFLHDIPNFEDEMIKRVMDLRRLRNRVTHGQDADFDFIDAEKYIVIADKTLNILNASKEKSMK